MYFTTEKPILTALSLRVLVRYVNRNCLVNLDLIVFNSNTLSNNEFVNCSETDHLQSEDTASVADDS